MKNRLYLVGGVLLVAELVGLLWRWLRQGPRSGEGCRGRNCWKQFLDMGGAGAPG
jgi:hypothetical protein